MKHITVFIFVFLISNLLFAQIQPLNASFETWSGGNPIDWNTTNSGLGNTVTEITTGAQDSSSYIRLETIELFTGDIIPGIATLGIIDIANQTVTGGMAYTDRPNIIKGYFKYNGVNGDIGSVVIQLTKWNGFSTEIVGETIFSTDTLTSSWAMFSDSIEYQMPILPDTMNILISSSGGALEIGSVMEVDNLSLEGTAVEISNIINLENNISIYPNPSNNIINVNFNTVNNAEIVLYNMVGQQIMKVNTSVTENKIDVSKYNKGIYFIKVKLNNKIHTKKIVIN